MFPLDGCVMQKSCLSISGAMLLTNYFSHPELNEGNVKTV